MVENSTCESFELLKTLDLPYIPARADKPTSSKPITSESPNTTVHLEPVPANVAHNVLKLSQVYLRTKAVVQLIGPRIQFGPP